MRLAVWREEQYLIASLVNVIDDPPTAPGATIFGSRYRIVPDEVGNEELYGGVDVSFPKEEGKPSVAVYVVLRGREVVYRDSEFFSLQVPYVSSYLSFREINPLERLVKKQMSNCPMLTPRAILVDGNGIMHKRRAGIACFLGVRTGLKTIGVGKTLYCHDGLNKNLVQNSLKNHLSEFQRQCREVSNASDAEKLRHVRGVVVDCRCIDVVAVAHENESFSCGDDMNMIGTMKELCNGFAVRLRGDSGTIWGAALLCHGGKICSGRTKGVGTKNPVFISVGHDMSLVEAVHICAKLSLARIPEPIRLADLYGRELIRQGVGL